MATNRCANRPPRPSQSGPNGGTPNPQVNTAAGVTNQQGPLHMCPGMYATNQDPQLGPPYASHPHNHMPPHPFMYIPPATHHQPQPPPMPPFLQYQWPMQYSYNPFPGFPPMGYGMVMPPFPPNPYLEASGYMLPQPHLQQVNYRRLFHAQFPATSAPYQNPNRRFQAQHNLAATKETVSSEVQTEPVQTGSAYANGSPPVGSESGHGTNSSTPSPSGSVGGKQSQAAVKNSTMAARDAEGNLEGEQGSSRCTTKRGQLTPLSTHIGKKSRVGQEHTTCRFGSDANAEMWSMCSSGGIIPVCSSSEQEDVAATKNRKVSFPDILMSSAGGTPPMITSDFSDRHSPKEGEQSAGQDVELVKELSSNNMVTKAKELDDYVDAVFSPKEGEPLRKILRLPFYFSEIQSTSSNTLHDPAALVDSIVAHIHSRNGLSQNTPIDTTTQSQKVPDNELALDDCEDSSLHEDVTDTMLNTFSSYLQFKAKMDESVWSVETLDNYVPHQDWLMQNGMLDPEVLIEEILEDVHRSAPPTQSGNLTVHSRDRRLSRRFSLTAEDLQMCIPSASWSTDQQHLNPSDKFPQRTKQDVETSAPTEMLNPEICNGGGQIYTSKEEQLQTGVDVMDVSNALASANDIDGYCEPEAVPSPNQEPCEVTKQKGMSPCSSKQVEAPLPYSLPENGSPSSDPTSLQDGETEQELNGNVAIVPGKSVQHAVEIQKHDSVSPTKLDCGSQCSELTRLNCHCNCHNKDGTALVTSKTSGRHQTQTTKSNRPTRRRYRQNGKKEALLGQMERF